MKEFSELPSEKQDYFNVTLVCENQKQIKAHKVRTEKRKKNYSQLRRMLKNIELTSQSESQISTMNVIEESVNALEGGAQDVNQRNRNTRSFNYELNEKNAKAKLLKGAKRAKNLDVEIKSTCVNMRFSDGSFHEVLFAFVETVE